MTRTRRQLVTNPVAPGTLLVPLTKGFFAVIDERDGAAIGQWNWSAYVSRGGKLVYAVRGTRSRVENWQSSIRMHAFLWALWGNGTAQAVDHKNGDGLDNRRENLRAASRCQNMQNRRFDARNRSGVRGVWWDGSREQWAVQVRAFGRVRSLGRYCDLAEASRVASAARLEMHREFAVEQRTLGERIQ